MEARSIENPTVPISSSNLLAFFGLDRADLPVVTTEAALKVPAVLCAIAFLSRTMAAIPLHGFSKSKTGPAKIGGMTGITLHEAPNELMGSYKFRQYFWQSVFTTGRGLAWIERQGPYIAGLWPMDPTQTIVTRDGFKVTYRHNGKDYPAADVIDLPFMLRDDQTTHRSPIAMASKAIQLALAMNDYSATFFAGGGVPPLALSGPLPEGAQAMARATADVDRAIRFAKQNKSPILPIPAGHKLEPVGFDPAKGQMIEARVMQIQEIARVWQLPPAFLQELSKGTFANVEQQDLNFVKHVVTQWAVALEDEMNLKLFGRDKNGRFVKHNLNALLRGDLKSRIESYSRAIQTAQMTPNEARELEDRPASENEAADELLVQGATVVLGNSPAPAAAPPAQPQDPAPDDPAADGTDASDDTGESDGTED